MDAFSTFSWFKWFKVALHQVRVRIGSPVTGYGQESRNRAARQRIPHRIWTDEDGVEHVEVTPRGHCKIHDCLKWPFPDYNKRDSEMIPPPPRPKKNTEIIKILIIYSMITVPSFLLPNGVCQEIPSES